MSFATNLQVRPAVHLTARQSNKRFETQRDGSTRIHLWITVRMAIPAEQLDGMRRRGHWIDRQKGTNFGSQ